MKVYVLVSWDCGSNDIDHIVAVCATEEIAEREKRERRYDNYGDACITIDDFNVIDR